jgi:transposase
MPHKTAATVAHTIGIDTGKNTLHLIGLDDKGAIVLREKIARGRIAARFANVPRCLIGIEAGMATHHVARELIALGHDVRQVPPQPRKPPLGRNLHKMRYLPLRPEQAASGPHVRMHVAQRHRRLPLACAAAI